MILDHLFMGSGLKAVNDLTSRFLHSNLNIWVILGDKLFLEVIRGGATNGEPFLPFAHTTRIFYL